MSNKIIAFCSDSPYAAQSDDGVNWVNTDAVNLRWKTVSSNNVSGKFCYSMTDIYNPYALVSYSTVDGGTTWASGVLPTPSLSCIVAVADDLDGIVTSYDGSTFNAVGLVYDVNYDRQFGGNIIYQTCSSVAVSRSEFYSAVNAMLFLQSCIANSVSNATIFTLRCKVVIGTAASYSAASCSRTVNYLRTLTTAVSTSIASSIRKFLW